MYIYCIHVNMELKTTLKTEDEASTVINVYMYMYM